MQLHLQIGIIYAKRLDIVTGIFELHFGLAALINTFAKIFLSTKVEQQKLRMQTAAVEAIVITQIMAGLTVNSVKCSREVS